MGFSATNWSGYVAAPIEALAASAPEYEVYVPRPGGEDLVLYRGRRVAVKSADVDQLRRRGIDRVYLPERDLAAFQQQLRDELLASDSSASPVQRAAAAMFLARLTLQDAFNSPKCERLVQASQELAEQITTHLADESLRVPELLGLVEHDYQTYTHACNVSVYSLLLARRLGMDDSAELEQIALGGLLHDVGKRHVPAHLLNKRGPLNDEEWEVVCRHPADGYRELAHREDVTWGTLMMVYQHHERNDGSGYPAAVLGDEIHAWAKICAVADVFDALTSDRPYRKPLSTRDVCNTMRRQAQAWFDAEIVECLCAEMEREEACHGT